jgi:hypothetical protein
LLILSADTAVMHPIVNRAVIAAVIIFFLFMAISFRTFWCLYWAFLYVVKQEIAVMIARYVISII